MSCKFVAINEPRVITGRHGDDCAGEPCAGCLPCVEPHCRVCGLTHIETTCAECVGKARDDLRTIADMCDSLPEEVQHRGVQSEAMVLLGPSADPEAWGHMRASVKVGRIPADYLAAADSEVHPLFVLGTWDMCWRAELDHDEPAGRMGLATAVDYLDRQLAYMAGYEHAPFEDFARDLRICRAHLERVLHDGEQRDTGAPCMTCSTLLVRVWAAEQIADGWECPRCRQRSTEAQYRFAVQHLHREEATELTDRECEIRTGVKAGTVRAWGTKGLVGRRQDSGRTLYVVADIVRKAQERGRVG